jgi:glycosyltransferase involved in cell wall biosynthesis
MELPMISIIIPTYNPGHYLQPALESIQAQTFSDWEIILVDDGSKTEELTNITALVEKLRGESVAITFISQQNSGVSVARNRAVEKAKGEFIAFLDNDDLWEPTKLQLQLDALKSNPAAALCHTAFDLIDGNGKKSGDGYGGPATYQSMLCGQFSVLLSSSVIRRSCWSEGGFFDPFYRYAQDLDVFMMLARFHPFVYIPTVETHYRLHSQNASGNYWGTYQEICHAMEKHRLWATNSKRPEVVEYVEKGLKSIAPTYSNQAFQCFRSKIKQRKASEGLTDLKRAYSLSPRLVISELVLNRLKRR